MAFHLSRETGKILRIVSRGSVSFAVIFRHSLFNLFPTILEILLSLIALCILYSNVFWLETLAFIILYIVVTGIITEWRAKAFKGMALKDAEYN